MDNIDKFKQEVDASKQHQVDEIVNKLRGEIRKKDREYSDLLMDFERFKGSSKWLSFLDSEYQEPSPIKPKSKSGSGEGCIVSLLSDWHAFETVIPETVSGLNEYNKNIAQKSILETFHGALAWTEMFRSKLNVKACVVALLGDLITNMLHEDHKETNQGPVMQEVLFTLDLIIQGLEMFINYGDFDQIIVLCVDGNHGRAAKDDWKRSQTRTHHSLEWLMYAFLKKFMGEKFAKLVEDKTLLIHIADGLHLYHKIYDVTGRFSHGDLLKYEGGVGGLTIPLNKAINQWNIGRKADVDFMGHWHTFLNPGNAIVNGSILGYSAYSISKKMAYERPMQGLTLIDSKRGLTSVNRIYVR